MEAEIIALAQSCCEQLPIVDGVGIMGKAIGLPVGNTTIQVSICKDNAGALNLAKTLLNQFTLEASITIQRIFGFERRL